MYTIVYENWHEGVRHHDCIGCACKPALAQSAIHWLPVGYRLY
ncbi:hypothetical protein HMPREF0208_01864 [Citrobacter koseri]|nr:hypothetical protein HMPREF3220_03675 [Citrobacter koseri]KXB44513.1 hypothetical protein HMPREF0208_01864 [Citrobacter koseri]